MVSTVADTRFECKELADLLVGYRAELIASWVQLLYAIEGSHYREQPVTELQAATGTCLSALAQLFQTGRQEDLLSYARELCARRAEQGFYIAEMIEGHLLLNDAVLPVIRRETEWDHDDSAALSMAQALEAALRWLVIHFSKLYSLALNARLREQVALLEQGQALLERRVREVSALVRSSALITSSLDLDRVLQMILEQLAEVVNYDRASIQLLIEGQLRIIAGKGFREPEVVVGASFDPLHNSLTRRLVDGKVPVVLADVRDEPAFVSDPDDLTRSWVGVPLMVRGSVIGALALDKADAAYYDEEDGRTVLAFANQAAIAIENARLYDRSREQDVLAERNRLARELHDSLSQSLFSMVLNAEAATHFFETDPIRARSQIQLLYETANAALKEMRTLIFELRPANLEQEGLAVVLTKHAKLVGGRNGIDVRVETKGQRRLPSQIEKALFRVAQEALNNVVKHSGATRAIVTLSSQDNLVSMSVEDNGVGVGSGASKPNTLGLTSMRERVEQLGGEFAIGISPEGTGTVVSAKVPCE